MYGVEARDYLDFVEKNWAYEPFNGGCPCFNVTSSGVMEDFARATREPFYNFHFCGTETSIEWQGYMDGAVESGERVANEVLYTLYPNDRSILVEYEKTYYHQKEEEKKISLLEAKSNSCSLTCLAKTLAKYSIILGGSYYLSKRFNLISKLKVVKFF